MKSILFFIFMLPTLALGSVTVVVNGSNHTIPQTNERGWGNAVTAWIQAISTYTLQPTGGTFTLSADANFGASYGLKSAYFSSRTSNPAGSGLLRMAVTDTIGWRNNANSGNLLLSVDGSDRLLFNGVTVATGDVNGTASSVSGEVVIYSGTTGKSIGRTGLTGVAALNSGVLSTSATVSLPAGGTGANITASHGGLAYSTASAISIGPVGVSGYIAKSNGAAAPSFIQAVPEANGGTNQTSYAAGDMLYATGTNTLGKLTAGATGTALIISGTATPTFQVPAKWGEVQLNDAAGFGSTATKIPYYTATTVSNPNGIFTFDNNSTNGARITFLRPALVTAQMSYYTTTSRAQIGITLNGAVTTNIYSDTDAHRKCYANSQMEATVGYVGSVTCQFAVTTNDIVRPHTDGNTCTDANSCAFSLSAIALPPF